MDFEKLGAFYLGKAYDLKGQQRLDELTMYDARDLTTHAICVGMTGSGKTGLGIDLLEEAAIDRVPALIIDPKGDITNLLLTFPDLLPEDFRPWINADDARRKGLTEDAYAAQQAESWRKGLAEWGQDGERIRMMRQTAEFAIYTPGSDAGLPVSILQSFAAPDLSWDTDAELLRERIQGTVSAPRPGGHRRRPGPLARAHPVGQPVRALLAPGRGSGSPQAHPVDPDTPDPNTGCL